jgi:head-tail adaptor
MASLGRMIRPIDVITTQTIKDNDGFKTTVDTVILQTRAVVETRNFTERWVNLATFSKADTLFKIRKPPTQTIDSTMRIAWNNEQYRIISVEDVAQRGRYLEILAEKIVGSVW